MAPKRGKTLKSWSGGATRSIPRPVGADKGQAEDVVGEGGDQTGEAADDNAAPEALAADGTIKHRPRQERGQRWRRTEDRKRPHRAQTVKLDEQAEDGGRGQHEDGQAALG